METDLRGRTFYGVHRTEEAINVVRIGMAFEGQQAFGYGLQMLFGFGNEKFKDLIGHFTILRQRVRERSGRENRRDRLALAHGFDALIRGCFSGRRRRKRESIALLECGDVARSLRTAGTDLQEVEFEHGDRVRNKFGERAVHIRSERGIHGVVEYVRHLGRNFRELREAVACGGTGKRVRRDVQPLEVLDLRLRFLQKPGILPQILEVFGGLLQEQLGGFLARRVHWAPSAKTVARRASTGPGLR